MSDPTAPIRQIWMYHEVEAPHGKMFLATEVQALKRKGWVDTPAQFGRGLQPKLRKLLKKWADFRRVMFSKE